MSAKANVTIQKHYHSKLLLFGEHVIVKGSDALAIPYHQHFAQWKVGLETKEAQVSNKHLLSYVAWLKQQEQAKTWLDIEQLHSALKDGLFLDSSIPQGYGVGSSGAVVAAIYERYAKDSEVLDTKTLKARFAVLEGYFHGSSSGTDPLVCYLDKGIIIHKSKEISIIEPPEYTDGAGGLFLLDTHKARKTEPFVELFQKKYEIPSFALLCERQLTPLGEASISAYLSKDIDTLLENVKELSQLQLLHLKALIPDEFEFIWQQGLNRDLFYLKLCGAGGGGYLLGFTTNYSKLTSLLGTYQPKLIHPF